LTRLCQDELERLQALATTSHAEDRWCNTAYTVRGPEPAAEVLRRAKGVLVVVDQTACSGAWPALEVWLQLLPEWFGSAFLPERTPEEDAAYLQWWDGLDYAQKQQAHAKPTQWRLSNWLYWLHPDRRMWYWWDDQVLDESTCSVTLLVADLPFPEETFKWLLHAAGATSIDETNDLAIS